MDTSPPDFLDSTILSPFNDRNNTVILGGGLAGLSAGYSLARAGQPVTVLESGSEVGGLARTIQHRDFRFDLGGHRFHTKNKETESFVRSLLGEECLTVSRKSKIHLRNRFFDYPLKPLNALSGIGLSTSVKALSDYGLEQIKNLFRAPGINSLEDWVVSNFGRTMFNLYFKDYSEKVWGIECNQISKDWVSQRIKGLSLWVALKNAFFKYNEQNVSTLIDKFIYPPLGIGQLPEKLADLIKKKNRVFTDSKVMQINHDDFAITNLIVENKNGRYNFQGSEFISSIPITNLLRMLNPAPPADILNAASKLRYRDLVVSTIMLDRDKITDLTWLYLPEKDMPLGRIHEPKNWSPHMAPEGKTHIVAEYFCSKGDRIWSSDDDKLTTITVNQLVRLGLINKAEVIDSCILRIPKAYPIFEIGYTDHYNRILSYLQKFRNLHIAGRTGMFQYYNMDRAIETGFEAAGNLMNRLSEARDNGSDRADIKPRLAPAG